MHIAIDDATRLAYVEVLADERAVTAVAFFRRALRFFARYGIKVERVMSDNGSCYRAKLHALCCRTLGIRHLFTRPYRRRARHRERIALHPHDARLGLGLWRSPSPPGPTRSRTRPRAAGATTYLVPPLTILMSWLILSETPPALAIAGGALCLVGVVLARR